MDPGKLKEHIDAVLNASYAGRHEHASPVTEEQRAHDFEFARALCALSGLVIHDAIVRAIEDETVDVSISGTPSVFIEGAVETMEYRGR